MITISMQYFGNKGSSSGKSGGAGGVASGGATERELAYAEKLEKNAQRNLDLAEDIEDRAARRQARLVDEINKGNIKFDSKEYKEIESSIDEYAQEAKELRQEAKKLWQEAADIRVK